MIRVGHGDSILIETPGGKNILIDAGYPPNGAKEVVPTLQSKNIKRIDTVVLSHHHPDHYGGLKAVVENFQIGEFWDTDNENPKDYVEIKNLIKSKKIPRKIPKRGEMVDWGGAEAKVINTYDENYTGTNELNNNSIVIKLTYKKNSFLFTGDLMETGERKLVSDNADLKADVLKCGHHGMRSSSTYAFLQKVDPKIAISSTAGQMIPYTLETYRIMGIDLYRTDLHGNIEVTSDGEKLSVSTQKKTDLSIYYSTMRPDFKKDGPETQEFKKDRTFHVKDGKLNGPDIEYGGHIRDLLQTCNWKDNELDGPYSYYYNKNQPRIVANFKDGKREGPAKFYYPDGQLFGECNAENDQLIGTAKLYYRSGNLWKQIKFDAGRVVNMQTFPDVGSSQTPPAESTEPKPTTP